MQIDLYLSLRQLRFRAEIQSEGSRASIEESCPRGEPGGGRAIPEMQTLPGWKAEIMQARVTINGEIIMGSDAPPGNAYWIYEVVFTLKRE